MQTFLAMVMVTAALTHANVTRDGEVVAVKSVQLDILGRHATCYVIQPRRVTSEAAALSQMGSVHAWKGGLENIARTAVQDDTVQNVKRHVIRRRNAATRVDAAPTEKAVSVS
jgi:uncharacterized protein (DUF427 family)